MSSKIYFITFVGDYSWKVFVKFLDKKSEYLQAFKDFKKEFELETGRKIKMIRSDNAKELISKDFSNFLKSCSSKRQLTVDYTAQQNGVSERMNRTLVEMARCW